MLPLKLQDWNYLKCVPDNDEACMKNLTLTTVGNISLARAVVKVLVGNGCNHGGLKPIKESIRTNPMSES